MTLDNKTEIKKFGNIKKILEENNVIANAMLEGIEELGLSEDKLTRVKFLANILREVHNPIGMENIFNEYNFITGRDF